MYLEAGAEGSAEQQTVRAKSKPSMWVDYCVVKVVSHLIQWGAKKQWRHLALAIFWSAYYIWIACLHRRQQATMKYETWYVFVFRTYYTCYFEVRISRDACTMYAHACHYTNEPATW